MSGEEQLPRVEEEEKQGDFTGRVFNHCTFNASVTFTGNVFVDSYGYRNIGDILRLQEQRLHQLQPQSTAASGPSSSAPATGAPPAPSRSVSAPLFSGQPSTPSVSSHQVQEIAIPTPQKTIGKALKPKKRQVVGLKEITQSKRKGVEEAAGPSSEKSRSTKARVDSDEYKPGETQIL